MGLFDFFKGKKKEETKDIEIKSNSLELDDIEVELKPENTITLDLTEQDNTTSVNQAVHKAMNADEIEFYTATGGKLYQEDEKTQEIEVQKIKAQETETCEVETQKTEIQEAETQKITDTQV